ncbi:hypothetical protein V2S66_30885 [Streptomyces sp. V4-01]|uniref:Uncharacterized protein n=1 Tax=Actinacidiphila polyblastidii TaxID=3110430 RepID=A0ABU7PKP6_9ACTN|nr:hypothetical protein [Streptomyces sp. V4-01]
MIVTFCIVLLVIGMLWVAIYQEWEPAERDRAVVRLASALAGQGEDRLNEYLDDVAGAREVSSAFARRQIRGYYRSAVRARLRNGTRSLWRPVDWVLVSSSRTQTIIAAAVGAQAVYIDVEHGLDALMTVGFACCGSCAAILVAAAAGLRRVRSLELAERQGHTRDT